MTLRDSLVEALETWTTPRFAARRAAFLESHKGTAPSVLEETTLRCILGAELVPEVEWGALCVVAENIRQRNAHVALEEEASAQIQEARDELSLTPEGRQDDPLPVCHGSMV